MPSPTQVVAAAGGSFGGSSVRGALLSTVETIKTLRGAGYTVEFIAKTYGVAPSAVLRCLEAVADKLAEKLTQADRLATFYEFDGHSLGRIS